ncbi:restriction endonuclease subunit S, partial [Actinobacillus pleuropneumoniae]|uniref:restriction endonuclease subunit S n=2 Tax=Actinobacillus pleuropneumoniae TaxID=715 RepID=UPI00227B5BAD
MSELQTNSGSLKDVKWGQFYIKDIFQTYIGQKGLQTHTGAYVSKQALFHGTMPRITVKDTSNGIDSFCYSEDKNFRTFKNFISVSFLGSVFYHPYEASLDMKVHALIPLEKELNLYIAKFVISAIKNCITLSSYGNQLSSTDLPKVKILLPVNSDDKPDWQFMEDFVKQKEQKQKADLIEYYSQKALNLMLLSGGLKNIEWREFFISDIFTKIQRGKRLTKGNQQGGDMPYVSSTASNNGVDNFIGNSSGVRIFENCLTLANSGSVGSAFFHHYQFVASDHVTALQMEQPNKYVYLFLSTLLKRLEEKYSFNREINDKRIQREKILLPVHSDGKPDWQFMEDFMRQIEKDKIKTILNYYNPLNDNEIMRGGGVKKNLNKGNWALF